MAQSNWEADKMLDVYIYDYLMKKKLLNTAKSFMTEGKVSPDPVAIDAPGGFLFEWWSVFWDIFIARTNEKHSETAAGYLEAQQIKAKEQQLQMQQLQLMRQAQLQRRDSNHPPLGITSEGVLGQTTASALAAKMYEDRLKHSNPMDTETSQPLLDARMALLKSTNHPGQMVQGNSGSVTAALQQIQARTQQTPQEIKSEVNMGNMQRSLPMDPSAMYGQGGMQSKPGITNAVNPGAGGLTLKGWPLTGIDQIRPGFGAQVQKPLLQSANQFQLLPHQQQQQILAQVRAQGDIGNSSHRDTDPLSLRALVRRSSNVKDSQSIANDESIGCLMQPTSSTLLPYQQQQQILAQVQAPGNIGNSSYRDIDPLRIRPLVRGSSNVKDSQLNANDESIGPIVQSTSSTLRDDMEHFGDVGYLDEHATYASKGFSLNEACCIRKSNSKVVCCHFSSDGELLASAGHDKKVVLWKIKTLQTKSTLEEHSHIITDVRFRPNSTHLATSSFDKTVRLWEAENPSFSFQAYNGHTSHVLSLDFHPKKNNLLCSSDDNNEIRIWNTSKYSCIRVSKGGTAQVRFQPRIGHLLAAASGNAVTLYDVETDRELQKLQGHSEEVHSVCWDTNGNYLASVSHDTVKVWSVASRSCIHEMKSSGTGNMYYSCVFHPSYSNLLVIGQYQSFALWNMTGNKWMTIPAHECLIPALATSPVTGMIASASHDKSVKIWK